MSSSSQAFKNLTKQGETKRSISFSNTLIFSIVVSSMNKNHLLILKATENSASRKGLVLLKGHKEVWGYLEMGNLSEDLKILLLYHILLCMSSLPPRK